MASARTHLSSFRYKAAWLVLSVAPALSESKQSSQAERSIVLVSLACDVQPLRPVGEQACIVARVPTGKPRRAKQSLGNFLLDECSHLLLQKVILLEGWIQFNQFTGNRNLRLDKNVQLNFVA